jgi:hypothetical protein
MSEQPRPVFVVRLRAEPRVDGIKALRWFLKSALRRFGLRALSVDTEPVIPGTRDHATAQSGADRVVRTRTNSGPANMKVKHHE